MRPLSNREVTRPRSPIASFGMPVRDMTAPRQASPTVPLGVVAIWARSVDSRPASDIRSSIGAARWAAWPRAMAACPSSAGSTASDASATARSASAASAERPEAMVAHARSTLTR